MATKAVFLLLTATTLAMANMNFTCDPELSPEKGGNQLLCLPKDYDKHKVKQTF